ncbi:DUF4306 domain-containing protein [Rossellomorea oryzaecorticis]|uniref:DUF4306 domain-containing protein n=1 Tax=Rossellomorea oryzaecorticis TaxID=1396505 RepID=A0ABU9K8W3_9BACI
MNRYVVLFGLGVVFLLFSSVATWYEGAEVVDRPFEWKYSTPFSGEVLKRSDILQLDYFVYAVKFKPTFPIVMALCSIYLLIVTGHYFLKNRKRLFIGYVSLIAAFLFILGWLMFSSTTGGARTLSYVLLSSGALCLVISILYHFDPYKRGLVSVKK